MIELLVVLIVMTVLASWVYPVITQHVTRADPVRAAGDLARIGNAVRYFQLNTFAFPGDVEDLTHRPDANDRQIVTGEPYSTAQIASWNGPYIERPLAENDNTNGDVLFSGYSVAVRQRLLCVAPESSAQTPCAENTWVAIRVDNVLTSEFEAINDIIDGESEDDDNFDLNGRTESRDEGRLRLMPDVVFNPEFQVNRMVYLITPF